LIADSNSSFILKFIEDFFGINDAKVRIKESFFRAKVRTNGQDLSHLRETQVQIIHLLILLCETLKQVVNLELYFFVLLIVGRVLLHSLDLLNVIPNLFC
jgi:hypothetical protein